MPQIKSFATRKAAYWCYKAMLCEDLQNTKVNLW